MVAGAATKATVAISQVVRAPVPARALGVAPSGTTASSTSMSTSEAFETFTRPAYDASPDSVVPNPESA